MMGFPRRTRVYAPPCCLMTHYIIKESGCHSGSFLPYRFCHSFACIPTASVPYVCILNPSKIQTFYFNLTNQDEKFTNYPQDNNRCLCKWFGLKGTLAQVFWKIGIWVSTCIILHVWCTVLWFTCQGIITLCTIMLKIPFNNVQMCLCQRASEAHSFRKTFNVWISVWVA